MPRCKATGIAVRVIAKFGTAHGATPAQIARIPDAIPVSGTMHKGGLQLQDQPPVVRKDMHRRLHSRTLGAHKTPIHLLQPAGGDAASVTVRLIQTFTERCALIVDTENATTAASGTRRSGRVGLGPAHSWRAFVTLGQH